MPGEREDNVFALRETVTRVRHPERGHFPTDDISPQRLARPFYAELPHAIYSSNRPGLSSRTARRRSPSHPEESPQEMFHGLFEERDGYRHINMDGISEVGFCNLLQTCSELLIFIYNESDKSYVHFEGY
jgi:hypothetical protein